VLDARGRLAPDARVKIRISVDGPAELVGFGSGNPLAVGSFQSTEAQTYHGRALAILRAKGITGVVRVEARAEGLEEASATVVFV
jgi:beta-galactosidase